MSDNILRLPPNQQLIRDHRWPVVGEKQPRDGTEPWNVTIGGTVAAAQRWSITELMDMPQVERQIDLHCVTRWSKYAVPFSGVPLALLLDAARPTSDARFVSFVARSERNHATSLPLHELQQLDPLVAFRAAGNWLSCEHGGPVRLVVPGRYFYKSLKWLEHIELLSADRLGYWEAEAGYHNHADPWREERYFASQLSRHEVQQLLETRRLPEDDFRSLQADGRDLSGLIARGTVLRDANFQNTKLDRADFTRANLTNAHFAGADLTNAVFHHADIEGADFSAANLCGADLQVASLFGATFCEIDTQGRWQRGARFDRSTQWNLHLLDSLVDEQRQYIEHVIQQF